MGDGVSRELIGNEDCAPEAGPHLNIRKDVFP